MIEDLKTHKDDWREAVVRMGVGSVGDARTYWERSLKEFDKVIPAVIEDQTILENENSNLRSHLLWCAKLLSVEQRFQLQDRLQPSVERGGVLMNNAEENALALKELMNNLTTLADKIQPYVDKRRVISDAEGVAIDTLLGNIRSAAQEIDIVTLSTIVGDYS